MSLRILFCLAAFISAGAPDLETQTASRPIEAVPEASLAPLCAAQALPAQAPHIPALTTALPGVLPVADGIRTQGLRRRWSKLYLDGKELELLGQGSYGAVYVHPRMRGAVIKMMTFFAEEERLARLDSAVAARLAEAGVGPKVFGTVAIPGEPSRLRRLLWSVFGREARVPDRPAVVKERIYGRDVDELISERRFTERDYGLIQRMLERMADARLRASDLRAGNVMIGHTASDPEPRAYLVDGGWLLPVEKSESREELLLSLKRHQAPKDQIGGNSPTLWWPVSSDPFDDVLQAGLSRGRKR